MDAGADVHPDPDQHHRRRQEQRDRDQRDPGRGPLGSRRAACAAARRVSAAMLASASASGTPSSSAWSCAATKLSSVGLRLRSAAPRTPPGGWRRDPSGAASRGPPRRRARSATSPRGASAARYPVPARTVIARMSMKSGMSRSSRAWRRLPGPATATHRCRSSRNASHSSAASHEPSDQRTGPPARLRSRAVAALISA